ncbi:MAG: hypothetical protein AABO41_16180 [Acidobacteriota bacterium]
MISEIVNVAAECVKHPTKPSILVPELGRYVCPDSREGQRALAQIQLIATDSQPLTQPSRIDPQFKLVFITAAVGSLLFVVICVGLHLYTDGQPPPALAKLIDGLLDMAKIGFGAAVGLLGGKAMQAKT